MAPNIKEKIWKHDFIDLLSLLPSYKDMSKSDKKSDDNKNGNGKRVAPTVILSTIGYRHSVFMRLFLVINNRTIALDYLDIWRPIKVLVALPGFFMVRCLGRSWPCIRV